METAVIEEPTVVKITKPQYVTAVIVILNSLVVSVTAWRLEDLMEDPSDSGYLSEKALLDNG